MAENKILVGIIMGSDSDLPVMKEAAAILDEFAIGYEIKIISAHRTPRLAMEYGTTAHEKGMKVIIAGAGGAAHLPGVIAAYTPLPVIGVPVKAKALDGLDSLLSIVQMPGGVPVATIGINQAKNAGILAAQIIGSSDNELMKKVINYKKKIEEQSLKKNVK
jgi:5-(carboxyamino)imidazole ribonucleotide mutase